MDKKKTRPNKSKCEFLIAKILTGKTFLTFGGKTLVSYPPSVEDRFIAQQIYDDKYHEAIANGVSTKEQIYEYLIKYGHWTEEEEKLLEDEVPNQIDNLKVALYNSYANFNARDRIREELQSAKDKYAALSRKKMKFEADSAEGYASTCRDTYLICSSVYDEDEEKILNRYDYLGEDYAICQTIVSEYYNNYVHDNLTRYLSTQEPWRTIWSTAKTENGVFGRPAAELTNEQKSLLSWSRIYDNIYENPDCPPDIVIDDDDMLDGWMIIESRKRKDSKMKGLAEKLTNVKGDEVYLMAETTEDAARIHNLNDNDGKMRIRNRQKEIDIAEKDGRKLKAQHTTDAQLQMRNQARESFKNSIK